MTAPVRISMVLAAIAASLSLAGCEGCAAERHARAQALDAGVVVAPPPPSASAPAVCYIGARDRTRLLDDQVFALCQGAPTASGPVDCYVEAMRRLALTDSQRLLLCRCATSAEPVDCVELLQRETFLLDREVEQLCAPTLSRGLLPSCVPRTG